jgi:hypothetical protein
MSKPHSVDETVLTENALALQLHYVPVPNFTDIPDVDFTFMKSFISWEAVNWP